MARNKNPRDTKDARDAAGQAAPIPAAFRAALAYENPGFLNSPEGRSVRILAEYWEPLGRFRKERIQDTVVFFGSARFHSLDSTSKKLALLEKPGSIKPAPPEEQPASNVESAAERLEEITGVDERGELSLNVRRARAAVEMSRYYEEARRLAFLHTTWAKELPYKRQRFVITSGGGPGIMEAANRGAFEAGGKTIGLNIRLPFEQMPNPYITPELNFEFHYFFMRKYWFAYMAKALVVFPGGFGTLDELFELLTLSQTGKLAKQMTIILYGRAYWDRLINFKAMVDWGAISPNDLSLFHFADTPEEGHVILKENLTRFHLEPAPPVPERRKSPGHGEEGPDLAKTLP
jgi:uncharacterized protein (TIGR00730 family)